MKKWWRLFIVLLGVVAAAAVLWLRWWVQSDSKMVMTDKELIKARKKLAFTPLWRVRSDSLLAAWVSRMTHRMGNRLISSLRN